MNYGSVGLNLQWNLWRGEQDRNRVRIAEAQRSRLDLAERDLLRSIEVEVERKWEDLRFDIQQIQLARQLRTQQTERYRIVTAQHREGVTTTNDVVVAETDLTQAELQVQRALIQYLVSFTELKLATGTIAQ
jgi:outer membrane protein